MTPIEKNVIVVDENGNEYEATYSKRAKGLVKNGRARFIEENKICLLCPPEIEMEDNKMSENINVNENVEVNSEAVLNEANEKMSIGYILGQIEKIQSETQYLQDCIKGLETMQVTQAQVPGAPVDIAGEQKAKSLGQIVASREATNQQLIAFYEKMYDDLKPKEESVKSKALEMLSRIVTEVGFYETEQGAEILSDMLDTIRHIG